MKIIYGVSGEGLGHVFESIEIISLLKQQGHEIKVFTYGDRAFNFLKQFQATRIGGIQLHVTPQGFSLWSTVIKNFHVISFYMKNWRKLKKEIAGFGPDVFITSFEPYTTLMSHIFHRPLITIDNQNELLYIPKPDGIGWFDFKLVQWATRICTWGATYYIVKTFNKNHISKNNIYFVAPIIQYETRKRRSSVGDHIFVYLTKPNPDLIKILKTLPEKFIVYCNNKIGNENNIIYRASGGESYLEDLTTCKAIIGTTGFSLIADALYLKKPYFGVPLKKQFEQIYNAHIIKHYNIGEFTENVTPEAIELFLSQLAVYREQLVRYRFDPAELENTLHMILNRI